MDGLIPIEAPLENGHVARCRHWPGLLQSESLEDWTRSIPWQQNRITVYGKTHDEPRLTAWFGPAYSYSSIAWPSAQIPVDLQGLNKLISNTLKCREFDAILCNLYRNGQDAMGWHRDNEREIDPTIIASVSLGAQRDFKIRHRITRETWTVPLGHGDLLSMEHLQLDHEHALPRRARIDAPRLNLTFRHFRGGGT